MTKGFPLTLLAATVVFALPAARAQPMKVFVAAQGSDSNPCTIAAPCLTFQYAHDTVAARGVIEVLNPADYGILTVTKAISIEGHGFAGIGVGTANRGIRVTASATDAVNLKGLIIEGYGQGQKGIEFLTGQSLAVENCVIRDMSNSGLDFLYSSPTTLQTLFVSNSYFADNGDHGILIFPWPRNPTAAGVTAAIERVALYRNGVGVSVISYGASGSISVAVTDSIAANNANSPRSKGFHVASYGSAITTLVLTRSVAIGNSLGVQAIGTNATLRIAQSTVTGNTTGYRTDSGGVILSYGDNYIDANGANIGALGTASKQ